MLDKLWLCGFVILTDDTLSVKLKSMQSADWLNWLPPEQFDSSVCVDLTSMIPPSLPASCNQTTI